MDPDQMDQSQMDQDRRWSLFLGSWGGTAVFVHASLLPIVLGALYFGWLADRGHPEDHFGLTLAVLAVAWWFVSLAIHELGRGIVAHATGVAIPELVVGPVGNLSPLAAARNVRAEFLVASAGWISHWLVCTITAAVLLLMRTPLDSFLGLLHPFRPQLIAPAEMATFLDLTFRLAFWCNFVLLLLHALPVWPFDGAMMWQRGLLSCFPDLSRRSAASYVATAGRWFALGLLILAWILRQDGTGSMMPTWLPLVGLAALVYLHARIPASPPEVSWISHDLEGDEQIDAEIPVGSLMAAGEDEDSNNEGAEPETWWERQQAKRREARLAKELEEDCQVDDILRRVHQVGVDGLTRAEKELLQRVSRRWKRDRNKSQD